MWFAPKKHRRNRQLKSAAGASTLRGVMRFLLPLFASTALAVAAPEIHRDLAYADKDKLQKLDVYAPAEGKNHPIVVWIHGGGWRKGDKAGMQKKPEVFTAKGYVLVSINYRFIPEVTIREMMGDVAKAIRWVHDHANDYRGDAKTMFVMGHSAGAHLAALVCTDDRYLRAEGLTLEPIKGCMPVDVSVYDLPKRLADEGRTGAGNFLAIFGESEKEQQEFSPVYHVAKGKHIPAFLILHVASRPETKKQSDWLAEKLRAVDVPATVFGAEGKTHGTINTELGLPDDPATQAMWKFLEGARGR